MLLLVLEAFVEVTLVIQDKARQEYQLRLGRVIRVKNRDRRTRKPRG